MILVLASGSAWPYMLIGLAIWWIVHLVRTPGRCTNISLFVAVVLITFSIGEIIFRVKGEFQSYLEQKSGPISHIFFTSYHSRFTSQAHGWLLIEYSHWLRDKFVSRSGFLNSEGLYDREHSLTKTKKCRVLALGDSFTQGVGSTHDSGYVSLLEKNNDTLELMNAGMSSSDPAYELKLLELKMFKYHPDVVIMTVNNTDIDDFKIRGGMERFLPDTTVQNRLAPPWWEDYYAESFMLRAFIHKVCKLDWNFMTQSEERHARALALRQLAEVLEKASDECHERHIRFVANFHPTEYEIRGDSMECTPVMRDVQKHGVETFDMLRYFMSHGVDSATAHKYFWANDGHNNNRGYAVMTEGLSTLF